MNTGLTGLRWVGNYGYQWSSQTQGRDNYANAFFFHSAGFHDSSEELRYCALPDRSLGKDFTLMF